MHRPSRYRKIYELHHGPIPDGYDIHHKDGDHDNNDPSNLVAVSQQEHYDIHLAQGDYAAAMRIAIRMKLPAEEISNAAKKNYEKRKAEGNHPFHDSETQRELSLRGIAKGSNKLVGGELQRQVHARLLESGEHPSQRIWECPHCHKIGKNPVNGSRWHFANCKLKTFEKPEAS